MTAVVISNPRTGRARRRLVDLRQALPVSADLQHHLTGDVQEAAAIITQRQWQTEDVLVVNGGDGTAQNLLTVLLRCCAPARLPQIALLPGGSTNMSAFDINAERAYRRCLTRLRCALGLQDPAQPKFQLPIQQRPLVRVALPDGDQYGFFFGIGTIVQGIEYFHQRIHPGGARHELGAGLAMLRTLWGIARHQPPFAEPLILDMENRTLAEAARLEPDNGEGRAANVDRPPGPGTWTPVPTRLCLVTALDRLFLGIRPYWSCSDEPLRATLVEADAYHFIRSMPRLLAGRPDSTMTPESGYHSAGLRALNLRFVGPLTVDGELFTNGGDTITVDATEPLRFITL